jgi:hypothetical protein
MDNYEILLKEIMNKLNNLENTIYALCEKNNICSRCYENKKIIL